MQEYDSFFNPTVLLLERENIIKMDIFSPQ